MLEILGSDSEKADKLCGMILKGQASEEICLFIREADQRGLGQALDEASSGYPTLLELIASIRTVQRNVNS